MPSVYRRDYLAKHAYDPWYIWWWHRLRARLLPPDPVPLMVERFTRIVGEPPTSDEIDFMRRLVHGQ